MRRVEIPGFGAAVLSDTVGFIRALPHTLIAAFHSTLEEIASASCLLLVCDLANVDHAELLADVKQVLIEIGASDIPTILVYNKIDAIDTDAMARTSPVGGTADAGVLPALWLSAETGEGVELLQAAIARALRYKHLDYRLQLAPQAAALRAQ